jgi:hypothetical protein
MYMSFEFRVMSFELSLPKIGCPQKATLGLAAFNF